MADKSELGESWQQRNANCLTMAAAYIMVAAYNCIALLWVMFCVTVLVLSTCQRSKLNLSLPPWAESKLAIVLAKVAKD